MVPIMPFWSAVQKKKKNCDARKPKSDALEHVERKERAMRTLIDHLLDGACRVDLHRKEVFKAVYFCRFFGELLSECI